MTVHVASHRRGITLLEVLVSLGILSIGLACVVALLPAGASEAKKAMDDDRRTAVAAAATADAITRGILNPATWTLAPASSTRYAIVVDPMGNNLLAIPGTTGLTAVTIGNFGAGTTAADEVFRSQDDPVYEAEQSNDDPPIPRFNTSDGKRASKGNFSWLATLVPATNDALPQFFRLSVIVCNRRGTGVSAVAPLAGDLSPVVGDAKQTVTRTATFPVPGMTSETFRDFCPVGAVALVSDGVTTWEWRRLLLAAPLVNASGMVTGARFSFDHDVSSAAKRIHLVQGAIGYAEHFVTLERNSPWTR
jgi:type II secretory pathway pseudopilin PulG